MTKLKTWMKVILIIVLLLIAVPLAIFIFIQFVPRDVPAQEEAVTTEASDGGTAAHRERHVRRENRAVRQDTTSLEPEEDQFFEEVGAISPYVTRSKQATPYQPGTVPGDSGVMVQYAGSPDDVGNGPLPPDDFRDF